MHILLSLILLLFSFQLVCSQNGNAIFDHLTVQDGLSQSEVNSIMQDHKGYMWIGTQDGLNRFDGYDFTVYRHDPNDSSSISHSLILFIFQDSNRNLWIGTRGGGLNLYDYKTDSFEAFLPSASDENSISTNTVWCMTESKKGELLIGSNKGLSLIQTSGTGENIRYSFKNYLQNRGVNDIVESDENVYWLATWNGLHQIKIENGKAEELYTIRIPENNNNERSVKSNAFTKVIIDRDSVIWAANHAGIVKIEKDGRAYKTTNYSTKEGLPDEKVLELIQDSENNLLIGTQYGGFSIFNKDRSKFTNHKTDIFFQKSLSGNYIYSIFEDQTGVIWISTIGSGINTFNRRRLAFGLNKIVLRDKQVIPGNFIRAIYKGDDDALWLGTIGEGFFRYDKTSKSYTQLELTTSNKKKVGTAFNVFDFETDSQNKLMIASSEGLLLLNKKTGSIKNFRQDFYMQDSLKSNSLFSIERDDQGAFWIGTWKGLHQFVYENNEARFIRHEHDPSKPESISNDVVRYIYNDPLNTDMWIGTMFGGLNQMLTDSLSGEVSFVRYEHDRNDTTSLISNLVSMIYRATNGELWVATNDGLCKMVYDKDRYIPRFARYTKKDGLPSNHIQSILEDEKGNLWLATNGGLSKFNPASNEFTNYTASDGLQSDEFSEKTCFKSKDGKLYFGGVNGYNSFYPDSIKMDTLKPKVVLTRLLIYNEAVEVGEKVNNRIILDCPLDEASEITLTHHEDIFSIEFAALHYASPQENEYAYRLEGFNGEWQYTNAKKRQATYTNLKGGEYVFRVRASNNDGYWNEEGASLKIKILPPWWETKAFTVLLAILLLVLIAGLYNYRVSDLERQKKVLNEKVNNRTLELQKANKILKLSHEEIEQKRKELIEQNKTLLERQNLIEEQSQQLERQAKMLHEKNSELEQLNKSKDKFFTIIAHDLRSPFNIVIGFLQLLKNRFESMGDEEKKSMIKYAYQSSKGVFQLLENLLYWSRSQWGLIELKCEAINFNELVDLNFDLVSDLAEDKNVKLRKKMEDGIVYVGDRNMINTIVRNLLGNSIKFTENGTVCVEARKVSNELVFKVSDTGVGIKEEDLTTLFSIDNKRSSGGTKGESGTGLGLVLCKDFVTKHKGSIAVESEVGKGTIFTVKLPVLGKKETALS